jgi:hypothetical protein
VRSNSVAQMPRKAQLVLILILFQDLNVVLVVDLHWVLLKVRWCKMLLFAVCGMVTSTEKLDRML